METRMEKWRSGGEVVVTIVNVCLAVREN
jgi:hypothetical protein